VAATDNELRLPILDILVILSLDGCVGVTKPGANAGHVNDEDNK
jgi:hypothetical protein